MAVKLRLQRHGRKQRPFYHIVAADARSPRDGRFIEKIGTYNPMTKPATIELDRDAAFNWLQNGAQPTDTVRAILKFKGVMFRKHLERGLRKGSLTQEQVDTLYKEWIDAKEAKIEARREVTKKEAADFQKRLFGTPKAPKVVEAPVVEEAPVEDAAAEEPTAEAEETTTEE
jgi:small subunit ribosomal protein S16